VKVKKLIDLLKKRVERGRVLTYGSQISNTIRIYNKGLLIYEWLGMYSAFVEWLGLSSMRTMQIKWWE